MKSIQLLITGTLLVAIFSFIGCSSQTGNSQQLLNKDTLIETNASSKEKLTNNANLKQRMERLIDSTSDEKLLEVVFDNLSKKLPADYEDEYKTVMNWNKSEQAIYMIWQLEAEVNNGGYNQFYYNSSGQFYKHLPDALRLVGATKFADLTQQANKIYEKENTKITKSHDGTVQGFSKSYENNPLNKFDDRFYALYKTENLQLIQVDFIRKHKADFIDN